MSRQKFKSYVMKKNILLALALCAMVLVGCKESPEKLAIRQQCISFLTAVQDNDSTTLAAIYPKYNSDYLGFVCDTFDVRKISKSRDGYKASIVCFLDKNDIKNKEKQLKFTLLFKQPSDSLFVISDSKTLFPKEILPDYAFATGCLDENKKYTDQEYMERLAIAHEIAIRHTEEIAQTLEKGIKIQGANIYSGFITVNLVENNTAYVKLQNTTEYDCIDYTLTATIASTWDGFVKGKASNRFDKESDKIGSNSSKRCNIYVDDSKLKKKWENWKDYAKDITIEIHRESIIPQIFDQLNPSEYSSFKADSIIPQVPEYKWLKKYNENNKDIKGLKD